MSTKATSSPSPSNSILGRQPCSRMQNEGIGCVGYVFGRGMYQYLAVLFCIIPCAIVYAAPVMAERMFARALAPTTDMIYRFFGVQMLISAALSYCVQDAVGAKQLELSTTKRFAFALASGLLAVCVLKMVFVYQGNYMEPVGFWITNIDEMLPMIPFLRLYGFKGLKDGISGVLSDLVSTFQPRNLSSFLYGCITAVLWMFLITAVVNPAGMASLMLVQPIDAVGLFAIQGLGIQAYLLAAATSSLKEAAEKETLGTTPGRVVNVVACVCSVFTLVIVPLLTRHHGILATGEKALLTRFAWTGSLGLFGTLGALSAYNAFAKTKTD